MVARLVRVQAEREPMTAARSRLDIDEAEIVVPVHAVAVRHH